MASTEREVELEDGEINDLEDGEIDEDVYLPEESSTVFSRLEPRQELGFHVQRTHDSYEAKTRELPFQNPELPARRWQRGHTNSMRGRYPRGRSGYHARGRLKPLMKPSRESGREQLVRGKLFPRRRASHRRPFLQQPNVPHGSLDERPRLPYIDERPPGFIDNEMPRLPHLGAVERPRIPLSELGERPRLTYNKRPDLPPPRLEQPRRVPSPTEEEVDDYRLLLERHRLIQQQLEALEKQENLADEDIIDDTFVDIPIEGSEQNVDSYSTSLDRAKEWQSDNQYVLESQQFDVGKNVGYFGTNTSGENRVLETGSDTENGGTRAEEHIRPQLFLPFRIRPQYSTVPTVQELSKKDLELRQASKQENVSKVENDKLEEYAVDERNRTQPQPQKKARSAQSRRTRRRRGKKKLSRSLSQVNARNGKAVMADSSNMVVHVDPHNELEARLMTLAASSVPTDHGGVEAKRNDVEKQKERREKLRQWQERVRKEDFPGRRDQQQQNLARPKKTVVKSGKGNKRKTGGNGNEIQKMSLQLPKFDTDDYYEIPMDVESDSPDGPALPLIEEPLEDLPPPPPPLPNGESAVSVYSDHGLQPVMMYQGGFYPTEQIYSDWMTGPVPLMQTALDDQQFSYEDYVAHDTRLGHRNVLENHEQQGLQNIDSASQENSDEDDEAALRELLLKSLADKRKAKLTVEKGTKSPSAGSVPASPRVQSPKTVTSSGSSQPRNLQSKQQQTSRQVTFAPPKHDPVVIKLGEDSDTDDSEASDTESAPKTAPGSKPNNKGIGGGLFGGLEMMIKEARKSAEASKVKGVQSAIQQETEAKQSPKTDLPPEPTTPDAMDHMPEQMKTEYRRLKEQLALRESKTRQPLTSFNQDKGDTSQETSSEEQVEIVAKDNHLKELQSRVTECELNLVKHRKLVQQDESVLSNMITDLKEKQQSLEVQEARVRKLQQQLKASQRVVLANRMLISKIRDQTKLIKEKFSEKQLATSNLEEELLRAKSILSAMKGRQPALTSNKHGRNSPQTELLGNVSNDNQKFMITPSIAQEMKSSLDAKLDKLLSLSKLKKDDAQSKRKLEETSDPVEETVTKKAKPQVSSPQKNLASTAATNSPRKSAMAERIAKEKARLKKLEHELSEKLKTYGRQSELEQDATSAKNNRQHGADHSKPDSEEKQPVSTVTSKHSPPLALGAKVDAQGQSRESSGNGGSHSKPREPVAQEIGIDEQQLECIRKLQAEKENKGPPFPAFDLDFTLAAHQWPTVCVSLPFGSELKSLVTEQDASSVGDGGKRDVESVAGGMSEREDDKIISNPLERYRSKLLCFKSYRLSSYFRTQEGFSLSSLTFTNKLDPLWALCDFDLKGKCNDEDCGFQHVANCKLLQQETLQDLAAYDPRLTGDGKGFKELKEGIVSFTKSFAKQYQDKMSWEELCILLVSDVKVHKKGSGPYHVFLKPRTWRLKQADRKQTKYEEEQAKDLGKGIKLSQKDNNHGLAARKRTVDTQTRHVREESQEVRYFVEEYNNIKTLEASLENSPGDVALWIKLARLKLHQDARTGDQKDPDALKNNIMQALNTLSRGLERNTHSEELWLEYLDLYASQSSSVELREICEQAVEFSPTYCVWWQFLEHSHTYPDKKTVCLRLLSFLVANSTAPVDLHSHRLLDVLLYLVQLELYCGHYRSAVAIFQAALAKKPSRSHDVPDLSIHVIPSDFCLAWLAYIHVVEFHRLPSPWFDPCQSRPSRMVTKEEFVFPWKPSQHSRASGEKLLVLFQDALKACSGLVKPPAARLTVCLPLYKNLIALEIAYGRLSSARGICRHLLRDNESEVVLWLCLAALEGLTESKDAVEQVYKEAMDKCMGHAELSYCAARFYLEQNEPQKAIAVLVRCVYHKFAAVSDTPGGEVRSLAVTVPDQAGPDPVALYRRLLSQPLPYDYKCPAFMPGVTPQSLGRQQVYLWLSYCLLLETSQCTSPLWGHVSVESAFETAVHSPLDRQDIQTLWTEYLLFQSSKVLQERSSPSSSSSQRQAMDELVNRCLMCVSTSSSLPHSSSCFWQDYRFHNRAINLSLSCLPKSHWSAAFENYLRLFPDDVSLTLWACQHELELNNLDLARTISARFISDTPSSITMWKVAIAIELKRNCVKEARKMYQQATEILPFAATLWKDFLMFEIAQSGNGSAVQQMVEKCRQIGVDLEEFFNTLLGK